MTQLLLPDLPGFSIEQITLADGVITVLAQSRTTRASCPVCASLSSRVHSRYERTLSDLPWSGRTVRLVVQVRRFFCQQPTCPRMTFVETIPTVAERYARRTIRLKEVLESLALALGGEQGSRFTEVLRIRCSPDTLQLKSLVEIAVIRMQQPPDWELHKPSRSQTNGICSKISVKRCNAVFPPT